MDWSLRGRIRLLPISEKGELPPLTPWTPARLGAVAKPKKAESSSISSMGKWQEWKAATCLTPVGSTGFGLRRKDCLDLCREHEAPEHVQLWCLAPWFTRWALKVEVVGKLGTTLFGEEAPLHSVCGELPWGVIEGLRVIDEELAIGLGLPYDFEEL